MSRRIAPFNDTPLLPRGFRVDRLVAARQTINLQPPAITMRLLATLGLLVTIGVPLRAQDAERAAVLATVQKVFTAMRTRDTALLRQAFDTTARLVGVSTRGGPATVRLTAPATFGGAVASAPAGDVWNERIWDPEVRIDGDLAQVWAYYTFHRNNTFSHCGVDAFMLLKVGTEWKITQLADSRRTTRCTHTEP